MNQFKMNAFNINLKHEYLYKSNFGFILIHLLNNDVLFESKISKEHTRETAKPLHSNVLFMIVTKSLSIGPIK